MSLVLVNTLLGSSPTGKGVNEDKEAEKKVEEEVITPKLDSWSVPVPCSSQYTPWNSVESATEMGNTTSPTPSSRSAREERRTTLSLKETQGTDEHTETVTAVKIEEGSPVPNPSDEIVDFTSTTNVEGGPVLFPMWEESNKQEQKQQQSFKSDPRSQLKTKPHICKDCGRRFLHQDGLVRHIQKFHSNMTKKHECKTCKMKFFYPIELRRHSRTHIGNSDDLKKCLECGAGFNHAIALSHHYRVMHNSKDNSHPVVMYDDYYDHISVIQNDPIRYHCTVCGSKFFSKYLIPHHQLCAKKREEDLTCKNCGKMFSHKSNLKQHKTMARCEERQIIMDHTGAKLAIAKCSECEAGFSNRKELLVHLRLHKKNDGCQSFKCQECGEEARNEVYFCDHLFSHTAESSSIPNSQDGGGGSSDNSVHVSTSSPATQTSTLTMTMPENGDHVSRYDHISIIQDNPVQYQCNYCKVKFQEKSRFINHKKCAIEILCKECGRVFSRKCELANHLQAHSNNRTVLSDVFHSQFPSSLDLGLQEKCLPKIPASHVLRHKEESSPKLFQCQFCGNSYTLKQSRTRHIRLKHMPKMPLKRVDATDMKISTLSDKATMTDPWEDTTSSTATSTSFLQLDSPPLASPPPKVDDVTSPTFPSFFKAVEAEPHRMEVVSDRPWPEWNLLLPDCSHPAGMGMTAEEYCFAPNLQNLQLLPQVNKPEPERLEQYATVFFVDLPMPTNEMFLIGEDFMCKSVPDLDMMNTAVEMEKTEYGLKQ